MIRVLIVLILMVSLPHFVSGQGDRRARKETKSSQDDQAKKKAEREATYDSEMQKRQEKHLKSQTKKTRKRMKANRKRSERIDKGTHLPFYKRWFRKKRIR